MTLDKLKNKAILFSKKNIPAEKFIEHEDKVIVAMNEGELIDMFIKFHIHIKAESHDTPN